MGRNRLETCAVDINQTIAGQVKDEKGRVLPTDVTSGQVTWFTRHPKWGKGRLLVSNPEAGLARSFSCGNCADICHGVFDPFSSISILFDDIGQLGNFSLNQCLETCSSPCTFGAVCSAPRLFRHVGPGLK